MPLRPPKLEAILVTLDTAETGEIKFDELRLHIKKYFTLKGESLEKMAK